MLRPPSGTTGFAAVPGRADHTCPTSWDWSARMLRRHKSSLVALVFPPHKEVEMRPSLRRLRTALNWSAGLLLCCASVMAAQGTGTVRGTVTDAVSKRPVDGVSVFVAGTDLGTLTNSLGQFQLNLPAGQVELRVRRVGYGTTSRKVTVTAGEVAQADFEVREVAIGPGGGGADRGLEGRRGRHAVRHRGLGRGDSDFHSHRLARRAAVRLHHRAGCFQLPQRSLRAQLRIRAGCQRRAAQLYALEQLLWPVAAAVPGVFPPVRHLVVRDRVYQQLLRLGERGHGRRDVLREWPLPARERPVGRRAAWPGPRLRSESAGIGVAAAVPRR